MDQKLNDNMKDMTKEEKNRLKFEMAQQKIELVNRLSSLVSIYSQSVVNFLRAFQSLAISIETVNLSKSLLFIPSFLLILNFNWLFAWPPFSVFY